MFTGFQLLFVALAISLDTFATSLAMGTRGYLHLGRWAEALAGLLLIGMAGGLLAGWI